MIAPAKIEQRPAATDWDAAYRREQRREAREEQTALAWLALVHFLADFLLAVAAVIPWPGEWESRCEMALFALLWTQACLAGVAVAFAEDDLADRVKLAAAACFYGAWVSAVVMNLASNMWWGMAWLGLALCVTVAAVAGACTVIRLAKARLHQFVDGEDARGVDRIRSRWQFSLREAFGVLLACSILSLLLRWAIEGDVRSTVAMLFAFSALASVGCLAAVMTTGRPWLRLAIVMAILSGVGHIAQQATTELRASLDVDFVPFTTVVLPALLAASLYVMRSSGYRLVPHRWDW